MRIGLIAMMIAGASPAAAQNSDWTFTVTPYVWLPGTDTSVDTRFGTVTSKNGSSDVLSDLDFAFMGAFEARRDRWGFIGDLLYTDLSSSTASPLGIFYGGADVDVRISALTGYVAYRVYEDAKVAADVLGGFRAFSAKLDVTLEPGRRPGGSESFDESWVDGVIGGRVGLRFSEKWSAAVAMDVGGFDQGNDFTWQALATVNYAINPRWAVRGGWRYMDIEKEIDGRDVAVELNGPVFGVEYKF